MENDVLTIYMDEDSRPVKELMSLGNMKKSLFCDQYFLALKQIDNYLAGLEKIDEHSFKLDSINNVFAFIGDRGTGKTSCMVNLGDFLIDNQKDGKRGLDKEEYTCLNKVNFFTLDLIDPTYFDNSNDLLSLFLAKLYHSFQKRNKKSREDRNENKRMVFLRQISLTYKHLQYMSNEKCCTDEEVNIERLISLSAAVDLKNDIKEVVDAYIDYFDLKDYMLLLRIDDIDLNAKKAGQMLELVRKYFVQPNILIFMALKMEQVNTVLRKQFKSDCQLTEEDEACDMMVERYLAKLIPHSQRLYMPTSKDYLNKKLRIYSSRDDEFIDSEDKSEKFSTLKQAIPELIFRKTRFLFYNSAFNVSYIVPTNLREIRSLLKLLCTMKDFTQKDSDGNYVRNYYNQEIFKKYFFENWVEANLSEDRRKLIRRIFDVSNKNYLNKFVVSELLYYYEHYSYKDENHTYETADGIIKIANERNYFYKISVGDVMCVLDDLSKKYIDEANQKLFFFLFSFYSIKLYEAYDKVTENAGSPKGKYVPSENEIFRDDLYSELNDYEKLTAGFLFQDINKEVFPDSIEKSWRFIHADFLAKLMYEALNLTSNNVIPSKVQLTELVMLCSRCSQKLEDVFQNNEVAYNGYRTDSQITYIQAIENDVIIFDPFSIFFNLPRIMECYKRFQGLKYKDAPVGKLFLNYVFSNRPLVENTVWYRLRKWTLKNRGVEVKTENLNMDGFSWKYYNKWKSCSSFRNVEIMQDFLLHLGKQTYRDCSTKQKTLAKFFKVVSDYSIKTYDKGENDKAYIVSFEFFNIFSKVLNELSSDLAKQFENLFLPIDVEKRFEDDSEISGSTPINKY